MGRRILVPVALLLLAAVPQATAYAASTPWPFAPPGAPVFAGGCSWVWPRAAVPATLPVYGTAISTAPAPGVGHVADITMHGASRDITVTDAACPLSMTAFSFGGQWRIDFFGALGGDPSPFPKDFQVVIDVLTYAALLSSASGSSYTCGMAYDGAAIATTILAGKCTGTVTVLGGLPHALDLDVAASLAFPPFSVPPAPIDWAIYANEGSPAAHTNAFTGTGF